MQDSRAMNDFVRRTLWRATFFTPADETHRDATEDASNEPPRVEKRKARIPPPVTGPGSQIRRYVHKPQRQPDKAPSARKPTDPIRPPD